MGSSPCSSVALGQGGLGLGTPRGGVDRARGGPFSETPEEHLPLPPDSPYAGAPRASARRFSSPGILYAQSPLGREQGPRGRRGHGKSPQRMKYRDDDIDSDSNAEKDGSETSGFTDGDSHADILQVNPEDARAWADGSTDEDAPRKQRDRKTRLRQHGGKPARRGSNTKQVPPERVNGARRVPGKQAKERRGGVKGAAQSARNAWGPAPKGKDKYGRSFEEPRRRRPPAVPPHLARKIELSAVVVWSVYMGTRSCAYASSAHSRGRGGSTSSASVRSSPSEPSPCPGLTRVPAPRRQATRTRSHGQACKPAPRSDRNGEPGTPDIAVGTGMRMRALPRRPPAGRVEAAGPQPASA